MTGVTAAVIGVDLGTTSSKALVRDLHGRHIALVEERTPWTTAAGDRTHTTAEALLRLTTSLLRRAVIEAERDVDRLRVLGVGVAGLAESGVLLDRSSRPCAPVIAWFDRRGSEQVARLDRVAPEIGQQFPGRTGLPWDCQASIAKLMWLLDDGIGLTAGHRWASVPEWLVHELGGALVREPSLASRTGLIDQDTGELWTEGADAAGLSATLLPPSLQGGQSAGALRHPDLPLALLRVGCSEHAQDAAQKQSAAHAAEDKRCCGQHVGPSRQPGVDQALPLVGGERSRQRPCQDVGRAR